MRQLNRWRIFSLPLPPFPSSSPAPFPALPTFGSLWPLVAGLAQVSLPPERRAHLRELVLKHFGASELTPDLLQQAASLQDRRVNTEW
jgi:hypothetical protein